MNANRALGLLAAILVTVGQAMLFAVDTSAPAPANAEPARSDTLGARNIAKSQTGYGGSRGQSGG